MNAINFDISEWPTDPEESVLLGLALASPTWRTDEPALVADLARWNPEGLARVQARAAAHWRGHAQSRLLRLPKGQTRKTYLPPFDPEPTRLRDEAIAEQTRTIRRWARQAAAFASKETAIDEEERRTGLAAATRRLAEAADIDGYIDAVNDAGRLTAPDEAPRLLITGAQGTGKSSALIQALASLRARGLVVWVLVPTHERAEETVQEYNAARARFKGGLRAIAIRGRTAPSRTTKGETMCRRADIVRKAQTEGVEIETQICAHCPLRASCEYLQQRTNALDLVAEGGIFVMPHDYAYLPAPVPAPHVIVIDEAIRNPVHVESLDPALLTAVPQDVLNTKAGPALLATLGALRQALTAGNEQARAAARAALTKDEVRGASDALLDAATPPDVSGVAADDEAIEQALNAGAATRSWAKAVREVVRGALREWDVPATDRHPDGRPGFRAVWLAEGKEGARLYVARLRKHKIAREKPVLWLDGTGDPTLCARVVPGLDHRHFQVDRQGVVRQSRGYGSGFSRTSLIARRIGRLTAEPISEALDRRAGARRQALRALADAVPATFVASSKATIEALVAEGMQSACGHFGALRGLNRFKDCARAIIIGCDTPRIEAVEAIARGYSATDPAPFFPGGEYTRQTRLRRFRDGTVSPVEVLCHPDPLCDAVLWQAREAEVMQALDRVRGVFQERQMLILNSLALPLAIDEEVEAAEVLRVGARTAGKDVREQGMERLWRVIEGGAEAVPLTEADLPRLWPGVWAGRKQAQRWLEKQGGAEAIAAVAVGRNYSPPTVTKDFSNARGGIIRAVRFRAEGARGRASLALVRADVDPAEALARAIGRKVQILAVDESERLSAAS
jgi:hypothetical protein